MTTVIQQNKQETGLVWPFVFGISLQTVCFAFIQEALFFSRHPIVFSPALVATNLISIFPDVKVWFILFLLILWGIIAVLGPFGPLKRMIEKVAQGASLSSEIIYSTQDDHSKRIAIKRNKFIAKDIKNDTRIQDKHLGSRTNLAQESKKATDDQYIHDTPKILGKVATGTQLGLRDCIFSSVLLEKLASYVDYNTVLVCFVCILFGLILTVLLLIRLERSLPALPTSLSLFIAFFLLNKFVLSSFASRLSLQVCI